MYLKLTFCFHKLKLYILGKNLDGIVLALGSKLGVVTL